MPQKSKNGPAPGNGVPGALSSVNLDTTRPVSAAVSHTNHICTDSSRNIIPAPRLTRYPSSAQLTFLPDPVGPTGIVPSPIIIPNIPSLKSAAAFVPSPLISATANSLHNLPPCIPLSTAVLTGSGLSPKLIVEDPSMSGWDYNRLSRTHSGHSIPHGGINGFPHIPDDLQSLPEPCGLRLTHSTTTRSAEYARILHGSLARSSHGGGDGSFGQCSLSSDISEGRLPVNAIRARSRTSSHPPNTFPPEPLTALPLPSPLMRALAMPRARTHARTSGRTLHPGTRTSRTEDARTTRCAMPPDPSRPVPAGPGRAG